MSIIERLVAAQPDIRRDLQAAERDAQKAEIALTAAEEEERTASRELHEAEMNVARIRADRVALEAEADGLMQVIAALREGQ